MAGRSRMPPPHMINPGVRGPPPGPGILRPGPGPYGPQVRAQIVSPQQVLGGAPPIIFEQKIATQHAEIQRLLTENQRLAATHVALRQELAAAQQEVQRLQQMLAGFQSEKERQISMLVDKTNKQEAELRSTEAIKSDVLQLRTENQKLHALRADLVQQVQQMTAEVQRSRSEGQQAQTLRTEVDGMRQEVQRARMAVDYEKKANAEQLEQRQAMEKNLVSMAREVEKLRAELTNAEKRARVNSNAALGTYNGGYTTGDMPSYASVPQSIYGDSYGVHQMPVAVENGVQYATGPTSAWGAYELQRTGMPHESAPMANGQGMNVGDNDYKGMGDNAKYSAQENHYQSSLVTSHDQFRASGDSRATEDWTVHEAPNGKAFYHNPATGVTQWEKPAALIAAEAQHFSQTQIHHPQAQVQSGQVQLQSSGQPQMQSVSGQGLQGQSGGTSQHPQGVPGQLKQENQSPQVHLPQPGQSQGSQTGNGQIQPVQGQLQQPGVPMQQPAQGPLPHVMQGPRMPRPLPVPLPRPAQGPILHSLAPIPHPMQHSVRGPLPQPGAQPQLIPRPMQQNVGGAGPPQPHSLQQNPPGASQGSAPMLAHAPNHGHQQPSHTPHVSAPPIIHQRPPVHTPPVSKQPTPASSSAPTSGPQGANLFVFGIPEDMGDQKLAELFSPFGSVLYAKVGVEKDTGRGKGYGFVSMDSSKAAETAILQVNGMLISGKRIKVELKRGEHEPHQQQSHQQQHSQQSVSGSGGPNRWSHSHGDRAYRPY